MTPQEEPFLQAAKEGNKEYIQNNINRVDSEIKTAAFILSPSIETSQILLENGVNIHVQATEIVDHRQFPKVITWMNAIVTPQSEDDYISYWTGLHLDMLVNTITYKKQNGSLQKGQIRIRPLI